jgi:hypothetical protein
MNESSGWEELSKGKLLLKAQAEEVILLFLSLHSAILIKLKQHGMIEKQGKLFGLHMG